MKQLMKCALRVAVFAASLNAHGANDFDSTTNRLSIQSIWVNGVKYQNVLATLNSFALLGVDGGTPTVDTFNPTNNLLVLGSVAYQGATYNNVRVQLNSFTLLAAAATMEQYTPDKANWTTFNAKTLAALKAQDPDSITWLTKPWPKWDGTVYDPTKMSRDAFYAALFPNGAGDQLVGLREVFYQHKPFADNRNPTKAEVDEWHRISINHLRSLVGYTSANLQVKADHALFIRALWGDERKFTNLWDKYTGVADSAYGPCVAGTNSHCGATFFPSESADQTPYLPSGFSSITFLPSGSEGVFSAPKSNIPWSIKWVRAFSSALKAEGFWGGHTGPWFHRETFGFSFWDSDVPNNNSNAILRAKWGGTLNTGFYPQPGS